MGNFNSKSRESYMAASTQSATKTSLNSPLLKGNSSLGGAKGGKDKIVHESVINRYEMYGHQN